MISGVLRESLLCLKAAATGALAERVFCKTSPGIRFDPEPLETAKHISGENTALFGGHVQITIQIGKVKMDLNLKTVCQPFRHLLMLEDNFFRNSVSSVPSSSMLFILLAQGPFIASKATAGSTPSF